MSELLPEWPHPGWYGSHQHEEAGRLWFSVASQELAYERARADAAMARLRVAMSALQNIKDQERFDEDGIWHPMCGSEAYVERAEQAIDAIGELPPE